MDISLIDDFKVDWGLSGKSSRTASLYAGYLEAFLRDGGGVSLAAAKAWLLSTSHVSVRRKRAQALRAFASWCCRNGFQGMEWARDIPLSAEKVVPQLTVSAEDYQNALKKVRTLRNRIVIEMLWSCGLRRSELARLQISDVDFAGGFIVIRHSKTGQPRIAPLSPSARKCLRRFLMKRDEGSLLGMSSNAIRLMLQKHGLPSSHAWRRGWAVHSLRGGVSEASVRAAAGWSSGAMVARYTKALSGELAMAEFARVWSGN